MEYDWNMNEILYSGIGIPLYIDTPSEKKTTALRQCFMGFTERWLLDVHTWKITMLLIGKPSVLWAIYTMANC